MQELEYIQVIVPLRLEWAPVYSVPPGLTPVVGDRVRVGLARCEYVGVVSAVGVRPDISPSRIRPIMGVEEGLAAITPGELQMWGFVAEYYMCSIGEVYKAAYPAARLGSELKRKRSRAVAEPVEPAGPAALKSSSLVGLCRETVEGFDSGVPVLSDGVNREIIAYLARRTVADGRQVLVMTPDAARRPSLEGLEYDSSTTPAGRREIAGIVRSGRPCVVLGTRMSVFLPFVNLGLVIVCDEHDALYKQPEPAPRYNGRDCAVKLASLHNAGILLCSETPSPESIYNCLAGKYRYVKSVRDDNPDVPELIDTSAEFSKNGMVGRFSRKLLASVSKALENKSRVLITAPWKDTAEVEIEIRIRYPEARTKISVAGMSEAIKKKNIRKYALVCLLSAEFLLKGDDFRTDEKAFEQLYRLKNSVGGRLIIQSADISHPVFRSLSLSDVFGEMKSLLPVRREFSLPPYTRLLDIIVSDSNEARRNGMCSSIVKMIDPGLVLGAADGRIRLCLPKDRKLRGLKREIYTLVNSFALSKNYYPHVHFDVDPL